MYNYTIFISTINEYRQNFDDTNLAIEKAIECCISHNVLRDFLLEWKAETIHTILTEYDEEKILSKLNK